MSMLLLAFFVPPSTSSFPVRSPAQIIPPSFHIPYVDDSVSSFAPSVPVDRPMSRETELLTTGAVVTRQSAIDRYLQETASKYTFKSIKPSVSSTSTSPMLLSTVSSPSYASPQFPHHSLPAATPTALESTTSAAASKQFIDNHFQRSTAAKHTFKSIKPTAPFTSTTTPPQATTRSYVSPQVPPSSGRESPTPMPAALQSTTRPTAYKHWIDSRFAQSAPKHTFKSIKATAAPLHPTALTNSLMVPRVAYDSSVRSSDCLCAYADAADVDERITMDKGPYFYLFVNGLPPNEQRRKRACGLCSGDNHLFRQRDSVKRIPTIYGEAFRSSRDSFPPRIVPYQDTPPLSVASYLAPYMSRPTPITPLVPAQAIGTTAAQTLQQFPVIRDWLTEHIRPILEHEIAYAPLRGSHQ